MSDMTMRDRLSAIVSPKFVRFCIVGAATAAIYFGLYPVFRMGLNAAPWIASGVAFVIAVAFQYLGHSLYTFRRPLLDRSQAVRFGVTVTIGFALSTFITGVVWPAMQWPELLSLAVVIGVLPIVNFLVFSIWVFVNQRRE